MKIGLHTRIKNPFTLNYFSYLASIKSWLPIVDKVIIVDGGSTDESINQLLSWCHYDRKITIVSNENSYQGPNFSLAQSTLNMQIGQDELLDCDWIIRIDADHVCSLTSRIKFESILNRYKSNIILSFNVYFFRNGKYQMRSSPRNWILNNKEIKQQKLDIGWGFDIDNRLFSDNPIFIEKKEKFIDSDLKINKYYNIGKLVPFGETIPLNIYRYGHFFFNKVNCIKKVLIWEKASKSKHKSVFLRRMQIAAQTDIVGIKSYLKLEDLNKIFFPEPMVEVISKYGKNNILGLVLYYPLINQIQKILYKILSKIID